MSAVVSFTLERDADRHDRGRVLEVAEEVLGDVTAGSGKVPTAMIKYLIKILLPAPSPASASHWTK